MNRSIAVLLCATACADPSTSEPAHLTLGELKRYNTSSSHFMVGGAFGSCWSDDDRTYFTINDQSYEWNGAGTGHSLDVNVLPDDPLAEAGALVNGMWFLGPNGSLTLDADGKLRAWKGGSMLCDGGWLYVMAYRQQYSWQRDNPRYPSTQITAAADVLASDDHGLTWIDHLAEADQAPPTGAGAMFTSPRFNQPAFIEHGRDNAQGPAALGADRYVFAVSFGDQPNGDFLTLGRAPRGSIMDPAAWQVYSGPPAVTGREGLEDANWSSDPGQATSVLEEPGKLNFGGVVYDVGLGKYLYLDAYYPVRPKSVDDGAVYDTRLVVYTAPAPWGPWTAVGDVPLPSGQFSPAAPSRWFSADGKRFRIIAAGPWDSSAQWSAHWSITNYTMFLQDVTLDVE